MGHKHQLCDLLIMPVQRITRYPLLLKEVYKYTEQANLIAEVEALQQARQTMEDIAKAANDIMDISRLQGFDVSIYFFTSILTHWGRITIRSCPRRAGPATYSQAWLEFKIRICCFICKPEQSDVITVVSCQSPSIPGFCLFYQAVSNVTNYLLGTWIPTRYIIKNSNP